MKTKRTKVIAASYLDADPLSFSEMNIIKRTIEVFGFTYILLDRKTHETLHKKHLLSFKDRAEIIGKELKDLQDFFQIVPIDETIQKSVHENGINVLTLSLEQEKETDFRLMRILKELLPSVTILPLGLDDLQTSTEQAHAILRSDSSLELHKKYFPEYSYAKFKVKTTKKIALTSNFGCKSEVVAQAFTEHDLRVLDLDEEVKSLFDEQEFIESLIANFRKAHLIGQNSFITIDKQKEKHIQWLELFKFNQKSDVAKEIFEKMISTRIQEKMIHEITYSFEDYIIVKFMMLNELGLERAFDKVICVGCTREKIFQNLTEEGYSLEQVQTIAQMQDDISQKMRDANFKLSSEDSAEKLKNEAILFANGRLKDFLKDS